MTIGIECRCGTRLKVDDKLAGKQAKCPKCGEPLSIPQRSESIGDHEVEPIRVTCQCGGRFVAKPAIVGKTVKCPKCSAPIQIPAPSHLETLAVDPLSDLLDDVLPDVHASGGTKPSPRPAVTPTVTKTRKGKKVARVTWGKAAAVVAIVYGASRSAWIGYSIAAFHVSFLSALVSVAAMCNIALVVAAIATLTDREWGLPIMKLAAWGLIVLQVLSLMAILLNLLTHFSVNVPSASRIFLRIVFNSLRWCIVPGFILWACERGHERIR